MRSWYVGLILAGLGMGCQSSSVALSNLDREVARVLCDRQVDCPSPGLVPTLIRVLSDAPSTYSCTDAAEAGGTLPPEQRAAIDAGRIVYDGDAAARCLAAIAADCTSIDTAFRAEPSCRDAYRGTVPDGQPCAIDEECAGDAFCDTSVASACAGVCAPRLGIGAPCSGATECGTHPDGALDCGPTSASGSDHCYLVRAANAGAGGSCGRTDADGDDQTETTCSKGLYCKRSLGSTTGTCATPIPLLAACNPIYDVCADDGICTLSGASFTCQAVTIATHSGDVCNDQQLDFCQPLSRLECVNGYCATIGDGAVGAACRGDFPTDCNDGNYCNYTGNQQGTCQAKLADGVPCTRSMQCESMYCDFDAPTTPSCGVPSCP